jgi:hypothetical protein
MDKLREHLTDDSRQSQSAVKRFSTDAATTTSELRDFVRSLKGRSPQEVMGIVASNALTQAVIGSTIATVVLLAVLTVPFAFGKSAKAKSTKPAASVADVEPAKSDAASPKAASSGDTPSEEDIQKASKAMGLDETKTADPKKNPLDSFDNLLDKVK